MTTEQLLRRNLFFERGTTRLVAKGIVNPEPIIEHAEGRAHSKSSDYVPDSKFIAVRDFRRAGREEGADWRNYILWELLLMAENGDDNSKKAQRRQKALALIIEAYQLTDDDGDA